MQSNQIATVTMQSKIFLLLAVACRTNFGLNVVEMIGKHEYPLERHRDVQTRDGYLLELHRIPHGKNNSNSGGKPAVLLMHALLLNSAQWIVTGPGKALGFILADAGYDVWMGNARGTFWSRKHVRYDPDNSKKYWNFSFHEIGVGDLPAMIDYILVETGRESLYYVGHSQGTTAFFIMGSERPEYNKKIRFMAGLAPAAYESNMMNPWAQIAARFSDTIEILADLLGIYDLNSQVETLRYLGSILCASNIIGQDVCSELFPIIFGLEREQFNETIFPAILATSPAGGSMQQIIHYLQEIRSGRFCRYDYGVEENLLIYGQRVPPSYDLGNVTAPVGLYYALNDWMVSPVDVGRLRSELVNPVVDYVVPRDNFNHLDFNFASDVVPLLYNKLLEDLKRF